MMTHKLPYMAMDGVLCDRPQEGCFIGGKRNYARDKISNTTKKETTKVTRTLSADQLKRYIGIRIRNPAAADTGIGRGARARRRMRPWMMKLPRGSRNF